TGDRSLDFPVDVLWSANAAGEVVEDSPQWREFTGQASEEFLGSGWLDAVHPEDRQHVEECWANARAAGSIYEVDFRVRRRDGAWRHMTVRGLPVREADGSIGKWVGFCRDVTEQVDHTELLFRERNFSNALIECLPGVFYVSDETGNILRWNRNAEVILGYSAEEFSRTLGIECVAPEHRRAVEAIRQRLIKTGGYEEREIEYVTKSGKHIPFWVNGKQIVFDGKTCVIGVGLDISKLKNSELKLRELNAALEDRVKERTKELEAFSYTVSHDLQAPLRAIRGFAEVLKEDFSAELAGDGNEILERIVKTGERMTHLIEDVLRYSRTGRTTVALRAVRLNEVIDQVKADFVLRLKEIGGTLEIGENLPAVEGEPTLLAQIFSNLFQNAINYRRRDVPLVLKVSCCPEGDQLVFSVTDNGIGIAPENREKVFQAFQRLHTDQECPGSGLGLATVKKAVEIMGGQVWLESQVGRGTTFFIRLKSAA
ncbi:MAG: sensor histidine kinase, partial [Limisphaerales bacterium]